MSLHCRSHVWLFDVGWTVLPDEYIMLLVKYRDVYYGVRFDGSVAHGERLEFEAAAAEQRLSGNDHNGCWEKIA